MLSRISPFPVLVWGCLHSKFPSVLQYKADTDGYSTQYIHSLSLVLRVSIVLGTIYSGSDSSGL